MALIGESISKCTQAAQGQFPLILVVDDDDDSLTLISYVLEQLACAACFVADGYGALVAAKRYQPSLILTDIYLPQVDGFNIIRQLRSDSETSAIPIVAVTALASKDDQVKILNAGFDGYISKPFLIEALEEMVCRFLRLT
ncbi:response regulator [Nodosilinea sp. P-1105]|uniref:response regulator n=1 Tax=Nodosilinea sp. P-1105 TaxID=2546229 RepID=UPI00146B679D|nr:response regulator [Nodosilinea sp. P-1105]